MRPGMDGAVLARRSAPVEVDAHDRAACLKLREADEALPGGTGAFLQRKIAWVKAVDGIDLRDRAPARRSGSSASPAAARPRPPS